MEEPTPSIEEWHFIIKTRNYKHTIEGGTCEGKHNTRKYSEKSNTTPHCSKGVGNQLNPGSVLDQSSVHAHRSTELVNEAVPPSGRSY